MLQQTPYSTTGKKAKRERFEFFQGNKNVGSDHYTQVSVEHNKKAVSQLKKKKHSQPGAAFLFLIRCTNALYLALNTLWQAQTEAKHRPLLRQASHNALQRPGADAKHLQLPAQASHNALKHPAAKTISTRYMKSNERHLNPTPKPNPPKKIRKKKVTSTIFAVCSYCFLGWVGLGLAVRTP